MMFQKQPCLIVFEVVKTQYPIDVHCSDLPQKRRTLLKNKYYSYNLGVSHLEFYLYVIRQTNYYILEMLSPKELVSIGFQGSLDVILGLSLNTAVHLTRNVI